MREIFLKYFCGNELTEAGRWRRTGRKKASMCIAVSVAGVSGALPLDFERGAMPELTSAKADLTHSATLSAYGCLASGGGGLERMSFTTSAALFRTFGRGSKHSCSIEANDWRIPSVSSCERSKDCSIAW